jgi:archaellum component FlaC
MLNDEDIIKLKSVFATKDDFKEMRSDILEFKKETSNNFLRLDGDISSIKTDIQEMKSDMAGLKELVQGLIISTDNIAKSISDLRIEYSAISTQLSRHELWIKQIAEKVGLKLATD